jgi:hypothetical protein
MKSERKRHWFTLIDADGRPLPSAVPGTVGGHRRSRIYGRLDCPAALRAVAKGGYVRHRVFFADEASAVAAGYRPYAVCLHGDYVNWQNQSADGLIHPKPVDTSMPEQQAGITTIRLD